MEPLARAIAKAEIDLGLTSWEPGWGTGNADNILAALRSRNHFTLYENELLDIKGDPGGHNIVYIDLKFNDIQNFPARRQLDYFHTFLSHLDKELARKSA